MGEAYTCQEKDCATVNCDGLGGCVYNVKNDWDGCLIDNECYTRGAENKTPCVVCDPDTGKDQWTTRPEGSPCGKCKVCSGTPRACVNVEAGQDPNNDCDATDQTTCGLNGDCDGNGACAYWGADAKGVDDGNECTDPDYCDGKGNKTGDNVADNTLCDNESKVCINGACAACTSSAKCGNGRVCDNGACVKGNCLADDDCKDPPSECHVYKCKDHECKEDVVAAGASCDDGDLCTEGDVCLSSGECKGTPKDCSDYETFCVDAECDSPTGNCVTKHKAAGIYMTFPVNEDVSQYGYYYRCSDDHFLGFYYVDAQMGWDDARARCQRIGMDLAILEDESEYQEVTAILDGLIGVWIGLKKINGEWKWIDGTATSYTKWNTGEPSGDGVCVELTSYNAGLKWNDINCAHANQYVCEMDLNGKCWIDDAYWLAGETNPADPCQVCDPDSDKYGWTDGAATTYICTINNRCYPKGKVEPGNPCGVCDPTVSTTSWSQRADGSYTQKLTKSRELLFTCQNGKAKDTYIISHSQAYTWEEARAVCRDYGGDLAIVDKEWIQRELESYFDPEKAYWLGGSDREVEGTWVWVDGTNIEDGYKNWGDHQPDDYQGEEHCLQIWPNHGFHWNDVACDSEYGFVCKVSTCTIDNLVYLAGQPSPDNPCQFCLPGKTATAWSQAPDGEYYCPAPRGYNGESSRFESYCVCESGARARKFDYSTHAATWKAARNICKKLGGDLAVIGTADVEAELEKYLPDDIEVWFGLTDQEEEGTWKWVNGAPMGYANWDDGEPNNHFGTENCVHFSVFHDHPYKWNDMDCLAHYNFLCEE